MRLIVLNERTDLEALSRTLLRAGLSTGKTEAALASLRALNPHVDIAKLREGAALLIPDDPSFKVSGTDPVADESFQDFRKRVQAGLLAAAKDLEAGNAARAEERAEVAAAIKSTVVRRLAETDAELKQQIANAAKAIKDEEQHEAEAAKSLEAATKAALANLAQFGKILG